MEATTSKTLMLWLAVTCITAVAVVPFGSAEKPQDLKECLSSLTSIEGCFEAIKKAISNKEFGELGQACCETITQLSDNCWPIVFPEQPFVPFLLKSVCALIGLEKVAAAPY